MITNGVNLILFKSEDNFDIDRLRSEIKKKGYNYVFYNIRNGVGEISTTSIVKGGFTDLKKEEIWIVDFRLLYFQDYKSPVSRAGVINNFLQFFGNVNKNKIIMLFDVKSSEKIKNHI